MELYLMLEEDRLIFFNINKHETCIVIEKNLDSVSKVYKSTIASFIEELYINFLQEENLFTKEKIEKAIQNLL